ncbi:MAG TPA: hypothetical protein DIU20_14655 [Cryomorphaceae bacterium]|nr:hypothetical protein [Cryomorphaceae bacterium]
MKIRYSKTRLQWNKHSGTWMFISAVCITIGSRFIWAEDIGVDIISSILLGSGLAFLISFFYENSHQYLTIKDDFIQKNSLLPRRLNLSEITSVKKFARDYTLKTPEREMVIDTQIIDPESLEELDRVLDKLSVPLKEMLTATA